MGIFGKSKGKSNAINDRTGRLERSKHTLRGFLKQVHRKRDKSTIRDNTQKYDNIEDTIDEAGRICYNMFTQVCPKYEQEIAGQATPISVIKRRDRDNTICETADAFSDYLDFFLSHQGAEDFEYGIVDRAFPLYPDDQGRYTDKDKASIHASLNLPMGSDVDNFKNYAIKSICPQVEGHLSSFVGFLNNSGVIQEILSTQTQLDALEEFITDIGREIGDKTGNIETYQRLRQKVEASKDVILVNGERKEMDSLKDNLREINIGLGELTRQYENQKQELIERGIDPSNIPASITANVAEIGHFKAETGKYKSEKIKQEEKERGRVREEKRKSGLISIQENQNQQKRPQVNQEEYFRQSRSYRKPTQIIKNGDSSAMWGDAKE